MFSVAAPPFEHEGEKYKEECADDGIRYAEAPAMLIPDQVCNNIPICVELVHQPLRNEAVNIF